MRRVMNEPRRFRGMGHGRKVRRELSQGGTGPARRLNETLGAWPHVRITPMFGRWGYFVGAELFACFPLEGREHDLWIRLSLDDQARALLDTRVRPHRRFSRKGWIELAVTTDADVTTALRWLRRAHAALEPRPGGAGSRPLTTEEPS
jgi:Luciferase